MNPLTQIKNTQKITRAEWELGLSENASWHERYSHSAYIFVGGLNYELTEGDLLAVFAQYGEIIDVNLIRDRKTEKSKGFAFLAYENQKSTVLAVDNLSGARVAGRMIRVEHVDDYKQRVEELEGDTGISQNFTPVDSEVVTKIEAQEEPKDDKLIDKYEKEEEEGEHVNQGSVFNALAMHLKEKAIQLAQKEKERKKEEKKEEKERKKENEFGNPSKSKKFDNTNNSFKFDKKQRNF